MRRILIATAGAMLVVCSSAGWTAGAVSERPLTADTPARVDRKIDDVMQRGGARYNGGPYTGRAASGTTAYRPRPSERRTEAAATGSSRSPLYRDSNQRLQEFNRELRNKSPK